MITKLMIKNESKKNILLYLWLVCGMLVPASLVLLNWLGCLCKGEASGDFFEPW